MARCLIAIGGNLGDVARTFQAALQQLTSNGDVSLISQSRVYRTEPVGDAAGQPYLNAAAAVDTRLAPLALLDRMQGTETSLGRTREVHWGPRTLDLDLILYGDEIVDEPRLRVPHPACWYRRFVLDPLCEIAPETVHPEKHASLAVLRQRLLERPLTLGLCDGSAAIRRDLCRDLAARFPAATIEEWTEGAATPSLLAWLGGDPGFNSLPVLPRLDASEAEDPAEFLRYVLQAALDEPAPLDC